MAVQSKGATLFYCLFPIRTRSHRAFTFAIAKPSVTLTLKWVQNPMAVTTETEILTVHSTTEIIITHKSFNSFTIAIA